MFDAVIKKGIHTALGVTEFVLARSLDVVRMVDAVVAPPDAERSASAASTRRSGWRPPELGDLDEAASALRQRQERFEDEPVPAVIAPTTPVVRDRPARAAIRRSTPSAKAPSAGEATPPTREPSAKPASTPARSPRKRAASSRSSAPGKKTTGSAP